MKFLLSIFLTISMFASSADIDKKAYRAYKKEQYKKAFELYKRSKTLKSTYNLAQFYEKGIGVPKNHTKEKRYFLKVYNSINFNNYKTCESKLLPYFFKTLKKLRKYDKYNELKNLCKADRNPYLINCPSANIIPKNDRKSIDRFSCRFYKKFPYAMKKLLHIHSKILSQDDSFQQILIDKYKRAIITSIKPVINYYIKRGTRCINSAYTNRDIENCFKDYKIFLQNAFLSQTLSANRQLADKASLQKAEQEDKKHEHYLNQTGTVETKAKAIKKLKELHNHVKRFIIVG